MYCSSCATVVAQGSSYCKNCGAKLSGTKGESVAKPTELFPDSLIWAIVAVFVVGLGCIIGLMAVMKEELNMNDGMIAAVVLMSFVLLFMIEAVFIWLLVNRKRAAKEVSNIERPKEQTTKELDPSKARALPEPVPSVTEHTTRTFEPIYSERKAE